MTLARVLVVVRDFLDRGVRLRMLELESRHEHPAASVRPEREGDRTLGGDEEEAGVVVDVVRVEDDRAIEPALFELRGEPVAPGGELLVCDLHAAADAASSARNRRTRSSTF